MARFTLWSDLNQMYTVNLIMTPLNDITSWKLNGPKDECINVNGELVYDVIPVTEDNQIIGVMTKHKPFEVQPLKSEWLITHDTPISDLVSLFIATEKPAFLVYSNHEVIGIISMADFNKLPARTYIYSLIGDVELQLINLIRCDTSLTISQTLNLVSKHRSAEICTRMKKLQSHNVDVDAIQLLYLSDMLTIIEKSEKLRVCMGYKSLEQAK
jgi:CBS domain containing-hemolysin-like protein